MAVQLLPETQELIDIILDENEDKQRYEALAKLINAQDKDQLEKYLLDWLDEGDRAAWPRTWTLTVLAHLGLPAGVKRVLKHVVDPPEAYPWTRHFTLINAANFDPFPAKTIAKATKDQDVLPRATALRLLVANGMDQYEDDLINMLQDEHNPDARWAAARALRNRTDLKMKPLRAAVEKRFIPVLVEIAADPNMYLDTRWECVQALASFFQKQIVAAHLAELLLKDPNSTMRRYYLEALGKLNQKDESRAALLKAVEDTDAQIRLDAAASLKQIIGPADSIGMLVQLALNPEKKTDWLVDETVQALEVWR